MFKPNESTADRAIRVVIGLAALAAFFLLPDAAWRWWLLLGLVPLVIFGEAAGANIWDALALVLMGGLLSISRERRRKRQA